MDKWLSLIATCARMFLHYGTMKANGVVLDEMVHQLETTHSLVAWAFALQNSVSCLISPITKYLTNFFSCRQLAVAGGFLVGLSYIYYGLRVESIFQLFLSFVASGIGLGLVLYPSYLNLQAHFQEQFPIMSTICGLFEYVGIAVFPPMLQAINGKYGLSNAFLLLGAILLNMIPVGMCFKEPGRQNQQCKQTLDPTEEQSYQKLTGQNHEKEEKDQVPIYLKCCSVFYYHKNVAYLLIIEDLCQYVYISWVIFLVSLGTSAGLSSDQAVFLSTVGGIGGLVGKICVILIFHFDKMNAYTSSVIPMMVNGICMLGYVFITDFYLLGSLTFMIGLCQGINSSALNGMLPLMVCKHHLNEVVALRFTLCGIAVQCGGLFSGVIRDTFNATTYVFGFDALLCFLVLPLGFIWAFRDQEVHECQHQGKDHT